MPGDDDAGVPTTGEFKCKRRCKCEMQSERKCNWGLAGISVVKREHEGRGAAGWVILFDPVRGLDESTRQRLCSSARLPSCSSLSLSVSVSLLSLLCRLSLCPVDRALIIVP